MKLQYLGTAAAEAIPALFCDCEVCRKSRLAGGRSLRSRSQAIIDDRLLLDFGPDTCYHTLRFGINLSKIHHCLITHPHGDHLFPEDLSYLHPGFSHPPEGYTFTLYGSAETGEKIDRIRSNPKVNGLFFREVTPFIPFTVDRYTVTPLAAWHGTQLPMIYIITDGEKTLLYGHDTDVFPDETWEYLAKVKPHFDLVSLDCTEGGTREMAYHGHMCLGRNIECRDRLTAAGCADKNTLFVLNHFSHNGKNAAYDDFCTLAEPEGFDVSYDGMTVEI